MGKQNSKSEKFIIPKDLEQNLKQSTHIDRNFKPKNNQKGNFEQYMLEAFRSA